jgi:hypothetical protein
MTAIFRGDRLSMQTAAFWHARSHNAFLSEIQIRLCRLKETFRSDYPMVLSL